MKFILSTIIILLAALLIAGLAYLPIVCKKENEKKAACESRGGFYYKAYRSDSLCLNKNQLK